MQLSTRGLGVLILGAQFACSSPDALSNTASESDLETTTNELVGGLSANISENIAPNSVFESETDAIVLDNVKHFVAYNSSDNVNRAGTDICHGHSMMAASYFTNGTWRGIRIPTPTYAGVSVIRGDPSLAYVDAGSTWTVFVSTIATSQASWDAAPKNPATGCVQLNLTGNLALDRACVTAIVVPKNGDPATPFLAACYGTGSERFDGGNLDVSPSGHLYAAYWDPNAGKIRVFRNHAAIGEPSVFSSGMKGHPLLVKQSNRPTLIAPDTSGAFKLSRLNESNLVWDAPVTIATGFNWEQADATLRNGTTVRQIGYTANWHQPFPPLLYLNFFFARPPANGATRIVGRRCEMFGTGGVSCFTPPTWITPVTSDAVIPSLATSGSTSWLSYWDDNASANGNLTMTFVRLGTISNREFVRFPSGAQQVPCPNGGYWGDYDAMVVHGGNTGSPLLFRYLTDSTASACSSGLPQHVSVTLQGT
jgi:hypothetical protein